MAADDMINRPPHYTSSRARCPKCSAQIECIDITKHLSFCLGNVVKYAWRCDNKDAAIDDLCKARWYLDREIELRSGAQEHGVSGVQNAAIAWTSWGRQPLAIHSVDDLPPLTGIVQTLCYLRRWGGHLPNAITVARHSILVAKTAVRAGENTAAYRSLIRSCLLHDAAEALYGDVISPLKLLERHMLGAGTPHPNDVLTEQFNAALCERYDVVLADSRIALADLAVCCAEARTLGVPLCDRQGFFSQNVLALSEEISIPITTTEQDRADWWDLWPPTCREAKLEWKEKRSKRPESGVFRV